jgi:DNA repair protein RadC
LIQQLTETAVMNSPNAVKQYPQLVLAQHNHEVFAVLFLDAHNRLLSHQPMFCDSRELAKTALALDPDVLVQAENCTGDTINPSQEDMKLKKILQKSLALIEVKVLNHIMAAQGKYSSMAEKGLL